MPCRDDRDNYTPDYSLQDRIDKLARIACAALRELDENDIIEVLLLKNEEVRVWWEQHKEFDKREGRR